MTGLGKRLLSVILTLPLLVLLFSCSKSEEIKDTPDETDVVWSPVEETDGAASAGTESDSLPDGGSVSEPDGGSVSGSETETADTSSVLPEGGTAPLALMYHLVLDEPYSKLEDLFVRPSELRGHVEALLEKGYTFIFADEYGHYDRKTVIMSFDDGYLDNYTEVFPIIKEYNVKITVFLISNYIGCPEYMTADMIKEMAASGLVSFQSHTATHPDLTTLSPDGMRHEFETSNEAIEALTGRKVSALCYPAGSYDATVVSVAAEYYGCAYTTVSKTSTEGYPVHELPRLRVHRGFSKEDFLSAIP